MDGTNGDDGRGEHTVPVDDDDTPDTVPDDDDDYDFVWTLGDL